MKYNITLTLTEDINDSTLILRDISGRKALPLINEHLKKYNHQELNRQIFYNIRKRPEVCKKWKKVITVNDNV